MAAEAGGAGFNFVGNAQDSFGLGSMVANSFNALFHPGNDNELLQQQLDAGTQLSQIQAEANLAMVQQQSETMIMIAMIVGAVLFLFIILWFLKS